MDLHTLIQDLLSNGTKVPLQAGLFVVLRLLETDAGASTSSATLDMRDISWTWTTEGEAISPFTFVHTLALAMMVAARADVPTIRAATTTAELQAAILQLLTPLNREAAMRLAVRVLSQRDRVLASDRSLDLFLST